MAYRSEPGECAVEKLARGAPAHVRDEADATGIALTSGVVQEALLTAHFKAAFPRRVGGSNLPPVLL
jgi:hypothetical protein